MITGLRVLLRASNSLSLRRRVQLSPSLFKTSGRKLLDGGMSHLLASPIVMTAAAKEADLFVIFPVSSNGFSAAVLPVHPIKFVRGEVNSIVRLSSKISILNGAAAGNNCDPIVNRVLVTP